jgi:hypothetical protein
MTTLSKEEYLKRYLSGTTETKEKKKKKKEKEKKLRVAPRMRIIDNDADVPLLDTVKKVIISLIVCNTFLLLKPKSCLRDMCRVYLKG